MSTMQLPFMDRLNDLINKKYPDISAEERDQVEDHVLGLMEHWVREYAINMSPSDFAQHAEERYGATLGISQIVWALFNTK